jgi:hypothetical protein
VTDIDSLRNRLGIAAAPVVRAGLAAADLFFQKTLHEDPHQWIDYLRGIDFHKRVSAEWLRSGTRLVRYDSPGQGRPKPFVYFTRPGTSPNALGTTFPTVQFNEFETVHDVYALVSTASGIKFNALDRVSRLGGGLQYIISIAEASALRRVQRG